MLPIARIEPQSAAEHVVAAGRGFVWIGRAVDLVLRISIVAALPLLLVALYALLD
jgi:hypothetical protein